MSFLTCFSSGQVTTAFNTGCICSKQKINHKILEYVVSSFVNCFLSSSFSRKNCSAEETTMQAILHGDFSAFVPTCILCFEWCWSVLRACGIFKTTAMLISFGSCNMLQITLSFQRLMARHWMVWFLLQTVYFQLSLQLHFGSLWLFNPFVSLQHALLQWIFLLIEMFANEWISVSQLV